MKKALLISALFGSLFIQAQRTCGTPQKIQQLIAQDSNFETHYNAVRQQLHEAGSNLNQTMATESVAQPAVVVTVPVVVHILYKTSAQNISDAQIASQMTVLNNDYRKLNADFATVVPAVWQPLGADMEINFVMASVDPNGNATTGITRKNITATDYVFEDDYYTTTGEPAWDPDEYLNIWVGNFSDTSLLGFAYPPAAAGYPFDGLCIDFNNFGTIGTSATAPFNKGRTATHEIGHYFGLEHPWGDDGSACGTVANSDGVADTPQVGGPTYFCPDFPDYDQACSLTGNGSMFMNYMDYVNDACMAFFTNGQKLLTNAAIAGPRASVLGTPDLHAAAQIKVYPNPVSDEFSVISSNQQLTKVELFNIAGQLVLTQALNGTEAKVDMHGFEAGIYFARFYNGTKLLKSEKLIKK
ncbi:T9SS type A sorting domain-containing protein [Flavobacterium silvaticum]|uniref:T9SS type A sorting domain-containing protein n=1 Tax=Flavobacterium silvaticum TaxID=1852020 RepID=A0A972FV62_9FLAO|nr:T9SS type A sorting domain-containing protein [Flavobacterium silvaticum]NMH28205.1 T9SS type A sorting domain-containing protein [Flavobacterium silvaticum]